MIKIVYPQINIAEQGNPLEFGIFTTEFGLTRFDFDKDQNWRQAGKVIFPKWYISKTPIEVHVFTQQELGDYTHKIVQEYITMQGTQNALKPPYNKI